MSSFDALSDVDLLARCRDGSDAAWNTLVRRYQRLIYTVPRRAGLSGEQAADVFQATFTRLFEHIDRIEDGSRVRAWLVTTAKRESLRLLDEARRTVDLAAERGGHDSDAGDGPEGDLLDRFAHPSPLTEDLLSDLQQQDRLRRALALLDDRARQFLELLFLQDEPLPYSEIAARLGIAEGSIGPTRARCLDKLRAALARL